VTAAASAATSLVTEAGGGRLDGWDESFCAIRPFASSCVSNRFTSTLPPGTQPHINSNSALYLADLRVPAASTDCCRQSRSAVSGALLVPWTRTSTGQRSFAMYGARTWNRLPTTLRSLELLLSSFKRKLNTHLSRCRCGCHVPLLGAVVTVQWVWRRLQMSRLDSTPTGRLTVHHKTITSVYTHIHPFNGPLSWTTRVSRYQKGKTNLDFTEARDNGIT